jgi:hypothetical protein
MGIVDDPRGRPAGAGYGSALRPVKKYVRELMSDLPRKNPVRMCRLVRSPPRRHRLLSVDVENDVWMTGSDTPGSSSGFASHWDGSRWTDRRPYGELKSDLLSDVAAAGGKAWFAGSGPRGGVIAEWDGHALRHVRSGIGGGSATLNAVSVKDGRLWAVGLVGDAVGTVHCHGEDCDRPLVLHGDGSKWTQVQVPIQRGQLYGVTAVGTDDVWVSGIDLEHERQALFLHYDGKSWTPEYGPSPQTGGSTDEDADRVNRASITTVPDTSILWSTGSTGLGTDDGDPEQFFALRRESRS